jgi:cytochrome o ubiquinol oxidase subunit 3
VLKVTRWPIVLRRLLCFSLFWHALDIVWVG